MVGRQMNIHMYQKYRDIFISNYYSTWYWALEIYKKLLNMVLYTWKMPDVWLLEKN